MTRLAGGIAGAASSEDLAGAIERLRGALHGLEHGPRNETELARLYEKWLRMPQWQARDEALPLLLGVDPGRWLELREDAGMQALAAQVWEGMEARLGAAGLIAAGAGYLAPEAWYRWAGEQGIAVPEACSGLMDFILRTVKRSLPEPETPAIPGDSASALREQVLGAALNILAKCPDQCYDEHGLASGTRIAELIAAQSVRWFGSPRPAMSPAEMAAFLDRCLE
ncbi:MAG: hypothetical protein ACREWG_10785 [Gammaproteobacteria bacterium]